MSAYGPEQDTRTTLAHWQMALLTPERLEESRPPLEVVVGAHKHVVTEEEVVGNLGHLQGAWRAEEDLVSSAAAQC